MGPTWVLSAPDGPHIGPMNLAIRVAHLNQAFSQIMMIVVNSSIKSRTTRLVPHVYISPSFNQKTPNRRQEVGSPQECRLCVMDGPHPGVYLCPRIEQHGHNVRTCCFTERSKTAISRPMYIFRADIGVCSILQHQLHGFRIPSTYRWYQRVKRYIRIEARQRQFPARQRQFPSWRIKVSSRRQKAANFI